ncbi:MAG TPA: Gfo/Idh/MocA family oxidoreductase, partial [Armatimonadota bacterium]|nr:Gfo/Idh/MocA family oxidoreductase [Armatimonadota bacterium]
GILGLGNIAQAFVAGIGALPDATVVACGSRSAEKAAAFGATWDIPHRHGSYAALAADPDVDAIYVATPHPAHLGHCLLALAHGKPVLCEKPFTVNAAGTERIIAAARAAGVLVMEAMWTRFLPHVRQTEALIAAGAIGAVRMVQADFAYRFPWDPDHRALNPALAGGGLLDVGVYPLSLAHLLLGAPTAVTGAAHLGETGVDEQAVMALGFPEGRLAALTCGVRTRSPQEAAVMGTAGMIRLHGPWWRPTNLTLSRPGVPDEIIAVPAEGNGYNYQAAEFGRCLRAGLSESPLRPLADTLAVMRVMDALRAGWGLTYPMEAGGAAA